MGLALDVTFPKRLVILDPKDRALVISDLNQDLFTALVDKPIYYKKQAQSI